MAMAWRSLGAGVVMIVAVGCAPRATVEPGVAVPPPPARVETRRPSGAHTVVYERGTHQYEHTVDGTVEALGGPAAVQGVARLRSATFMTLRTEPAANGARLQVSIDSFSVHGTEPRIPSPDASELDAAAFAVLVQESGRTERITAAGVGCPGGNPMEGTMRELVVPLPRELRRGAEWVDTLVTVTCREGVPITTVTSSAYRLLGFEERQGQRLLRIGRTSATRTDGAQVRRGQAIGLSGTGTEEATLLVDAARGILVEAEGAVSVDLLLSGRDGEIPLRQRFTQRVRLLEP